MTIDKSELKRLVTQVFGEGWQIVPKEPTREMQNCMDKGSAYNTWFNMLADAPTYEGEGK